MSKQVIPESGEALTPALRFEFEPNGHFIRTGCLLCGRSFRLDDPSPTIKTATGQRLGDICFDCMEASAGCLVWPSRERWDEICKHGPGAKPGPDYCGRCTHCGTPLNEGGE